MVSVYLFFVNCNASSIQRCPSFPIIGRFLCLFAAGYRAEDRKDFNRILVRFSIQSRQLRRQCWTDERFQLIGGSINPFTASGVVPGLELETVSSGKIVFSTLGSFFKQLFTNYYNQLFISASGRMRFVKRFKMYRK